MITLEQKGAFFLRYIYVFYGPNVVDFTPKITARRVRVYVQHVVMRLRLIRGMQAKHFALVALLSLASVIFIFIHLEGEIARLDSERIKLEQRLAGSLDGNFRRIRAPAEYNSNQDSPLMTEVDDLVVIYNRVPKTGSTSFAGIAYELCVRNKFNVLHLNVTKNNHVLSVSDQMRFVNNITNWHSKKPSLYHGHVAYLEFTRFGISQRPIYINLVRDPLDRLVSYYYFLRHGDDFRPHLKRRRSGNKETFDECVAKDGEDCDPENLWMQIPFFCGHAAECWIPGNRWALEQAKQNLINNYLVVGVTEELGDFVAVLEATLPRFFAGATELYNSGRKSHLRKTFNKVIPREDTIRKIQDSDVWKMENDFYHYVKEQFHVVKKRTFEYKNGYMVERQQQFGYEKIRPR
jgi:heparan sulfate 2-O-sulfotransferase HS2ST1